MTYEVERVIQISGNAESMRIILFDKAFQNILGTFQAGDLG